MTRNRHARRLVPALFLAVFLTACGGSTSTPAVDSKQLQERLDQFVNAVTKPQAGAEFSAKAEGGAKVETKDDGTVIGTLPRMTFTAKEGNTAVLDPIQVRFSNGGEGKINFDATIPSTMSVKDKTGKVEGEVKIGSQTLKGVWIDKLQTIDDLDMQLSNITTSAPGQPGAGKIDKIAMSGKLEPKGGGLFDASYQGAVTGFTVEDPAEKSTMKMGSIGFEAKMAGTRLEDWAKAAKEAGYTLANPEIFKVYSGGPIDPKMIAFMKRLPEFMGSIDYVYSVKDVQMVQDGKQQFNLKHSSLGFGAAGDGKGTTKVRMTLGVGGIESSKEEPLLPPEADIQDASFEIEATGVPGQKLWDIYMDALPQLQAEAAKMANDTAKGESATTAGTAALEQVGMDLSGKFMEVMSAAKLAIAFNKLNLSTPTAKMTGKGLATYLPAQSMMPEGKISLRFSGIDALAKAMQKRGPKDELAQQIMGAVMAVRSMGKADPASSKDDQAYIIDIEITKDGKVLANGQDLLAQ
ncbi:MAG: hypothetical protein K8S25_02235 [Alphaproteobacteria bacterium]|nr:hypothetical protein [Alphaproteobacteria bacterium]